MLCIACAAPGHPLCPACESGLAVAPDHVVGGVAVGSPFRHSGTAARLVHNLKYRRSRTAGLFLAAAMAGRVPVDATVLVPVRRSLARRVKFGIDQAVFLATHVAKDTGLPMIDGVAPPLWWSRHAGASRDRREPVAFRQRRPLPDGAVLVDDVMTTGTTLGSAAAAFAPSRMSYLVATVAGTMNSGASMAPNLGGAVAVDRRSRTGRAPSAQRPSRNVHPGRYRFARAATRAPDREEHG